MYDWVSTTADHGAAGTELAPWRGTGHALTLRDPGDVVTVRGGRNEPRAPAHNAGRPHPLAGDVDISGELAPR